MTMPQDHPQRIELNDEVHARPPDALKAPLRLSYLVLLSDWANREREWEHVHALAERYGAPPPAPGASHYSAYLGPFHLRWERHGEFGRYTFCVPDAPESAFERPAIEAVPAAWIEALPGEIVIATHAALLDHLPDVLEHETIAHRYFTGNALVGASIAGGAAVALTDFRVRADRFSRLVVFNPAMGPRQAGRMLQRLLDIDTYRVMALLALPIARGLTPFLSRCERELAEITSALAGAVDADEPVLLDRLTRLAAQIEEREAINHYRFSAAAAYYDLVRARILELREERIQGLQTFQEFTERRLAPAMNTCRATAARQESLSGRVARATQLLSTRVDVTHERQNQAVLESMNRRARMQLRLQETVEGLSIAAVTYYIVGLVGYAAKGMKAAGMRVEPDIAMGLAIPLVLILAALGVRKIRRMVTAGGTRS